MSFKGIPSSEHFRYINNADPMKAKQLDKGDPIDGRRSCSCLL
jgi:peptide subunit release factor RF-3